MSSSLALSSSSAASKVSSRPALCASEKSLLQAMIETTGKSPRIPFFSLCDQFIFERTTRINAIVQRLNPRGTRSEFSASETIAYTLGLKNFFKDRVVEALSDSFICKFALLKLLSSERRPDVFLAPFFHDKELVVKKGISRFATYEKGADFEAHYACHRGLEAEISPLIQDIKMAQKLYAKLALYSIPDLHLLSSSAIELDPDQSAPRQIVTQRQIQDMILFLALHDENAIANQHILIRVPYLDKLLALGSATSPFSASGWDQVETTLITFMLFTLKQKSLFKDKLSKALSGSYTYENFCEENEIDKAKDMTESHFHSMLNQFVHYTLFLFESTKDILCHMQPLVVREFGPRDLSYRFEFSSKVQEALNIHLEVAKSSYVSPSFLTIPSVLEDYLSPFKEDLSQVGSFFEEFASYPDYYSQGSLIEAYSSFIAGIEEGSLSHNLVFSFIVFKEQLEQMLAIFEEKINALGPLMQRMHAHIKKTAIEEDKKEALVTFSNEFFGKLSVFSLSTCVINKLTLSLFRDAIFDRKPFDISFDVTPFEGDIESDIKIILPKPKEALVESVASLSPSAVLATSAELKVVEPSFVLPRDLSSRKVEAILRANGFELVRTRGSHFFYRHSTMKKTVTLPVGYDSIAIGTLKSIFEQAGLI